MTKRLIRPRRLATAVLVVLGLAGLSACLPATPPTALSISASPGLFPAFDTTVSDYVVRCDGSAVRVDVAAPSDTQVSVGGQAAQSGTFSASVPLDVDQAFTITVQQASRPATEHHVRCLPHNFPNWTSSQSGSGHAAFYMTTPWNQAGAFLYPVIVDNHGVPVWWGPTIASIYTKLLPNGHIGSLINNGGFAERTLSGQLVRTADPVGGPVDPHDVLLLPNDHVVVVANVVKPGVDLSSIGGPANTSILDHVIQEIDPDTDQVVWSWDATDHLAIDEMDPQWYAQYIAGASAPYDVFHWNSIEAVPGGYLLSFRHLDAVLRIDATTGDIEWKLGGTPTPQSLTIVDDPVFAGGSHLGGQHDARLTPDGTVTLYDDGTGLGRRPRAVGYAVDTTNRTATLVSAMTDPAVASAFCCGNARRLGPYDWVVGWGGDPNGVGSENVGGQRAFSLSFPGLLMYRMEPLTRAQVTIEQLRAAMDQHAALGLQSTSLPGPAPISP
jgi:hypothetical protein